MSKIQISIDVDKMEKSRIITRTYKNKEGVEVKQRLMKFDVIDLKEPKVVASGSGWKLIKTCFITNTPSDDEKKAKTKMTIIGDGVKFDGDNSSMEFKPNETNPA